MQVQTIYTKDILHKCKNIQACIERLDHYRNHLIALQHQGYELEDPFLDGFAVVIKEESKPPPRKRCLLEPTPSHEEREQNTRDKHASDEVGHDEQSLKEDRSIDSDSRSGTE